MTNMMLRNMQVGPGHEHVLGLQGLQVQRARLRQVEDHGHQGRAGDQAGSDIPRMVTSGLIAIRTACLRITTRSCRPRARAARIKGCPRMSNRLALSMRMLSAAPDTAVIKGRYPKVLEQIDDLLKIHRAFTNVSENSPPIDSPKEKVLTNSKTRASRKPGMPRPIKLIVVKTWSQKEY